MLKDALFFYFSTFRSHLVEHLAHYKTVTKKLRKAHNFSMLIIVRSLMDVVHDVLKKKLMYIM